MALITRKPGKVIHHSDAGKWVCAPRWEVWVMLMTMQWLKFFASLECELIDRRSWKNKTEARLAIFTWIESWYNPTRRHSGLGYLSPNNFERKLNEKNQSADKLQSAFTGRDSLDSIKKCPSNWDNSIFHIKCHYCSVKYIPLKR